MVKCHTLTPSRKQTILTRYEFRGTGRRVDYSSSEKMGKRLVLFHLGACVDQQHKTDANDDSKRDVDRGDEQTLQQTYSPKGSARCVQNFDDSLVFAIRMTYRISLRSSSLWEPRHPLLKVLVSFHRILHSEEYIDEFQSEVGGSHL